MGDIHKLKKSFMCIVNKILVCVKKLLKNY